MRKPVNHRETTDPWWSSQGVKIGVLDAKPSKKKGMVGMVQTDKGKGLGED